MANTNPYLTFSSPNSFTLATANGAKNWDGTLQYSTDLSTWNTWDGTTTLNSSDGTEHVLYVRGTGNSVISGGSGKRWMLAGTNISCSGNIENLLNYEIVTTGAHPNMGSNSYAFMFRNCTSLTIAPELPAVTLADDCYKGMFYGCTSLTTAPKLPAIILADQCYYAMFQSCTSLTIAPELPATTLATYNCYRQMFYGCTSLTIAPELPATTLTENCYNSMFWGCTNLTAAPKLLPANTLSLGCCRDMFHNCVSLTSAPELPATILAYSCYNGMFNGCTSLKLSTTQVGKYTTQYRIPSSGTGGTATYALSDMFSNTGGTFTGTPEINTTYYLYTYPKYVDSINLRGSVKYLKHSNLANNLSTASSSSIPTVKAIRDYREFTTEQYNTIANLLNLPTSSDTVSYITPTDDVVVDIELDEKLLNVTHKDTISNVAAAEDNNELAISSTTREFLSLTDEQYNTLTSIING